MSGVVPATTKRLFSSQDMALLVLEAKLHCRLCETYGTVAALDEYVERTGWTYVSTSSVWLIGYVVVADEYLVDIDDVPLLVLNALLGWTSFRVYACPIQEATISADKIRVRPESLSLSRLLQVTLLDLR
ncbi:hypothetical protein ACHHYP_06677 [Achlya hypogyna]|uniref:Uncharacterized protein n=1 Tax=Achlya hypogyna TaxID=1202772 RepID=A0A1V9YSK5_ACHHY|nr:hypothetical protein ACHHYP_06677 [Achlya hypogyna]